MKKQRNEKPIDEELLMRMMAGEAAGTGEYHERIAKISVMLTGGKVSLSAYIDNVLAQHFEQYREEIEAAYAGKLENLF